VSSLAVGSDAKRIPAVSVRGDRKAIRQNVAELACVQSRSRLDALLSNDRREPADSTEAAYEPAGSEGCEVDKGRPLTNQPNRRNTVYNPGRVSARSVVGHIRVSAARQVLARLPRWTRFAPGGSRSEWAAFSR